MVSFKVTHNVKPKRTQEVTCNTLAQLIQYIQNTFSVQKKNIKFMKPPLKDQASFIKSVKEGGQVLFLGPKKKQMTEEQVKKQENKKQKEQEKMEEVKKKIQDLKINDHERIQKKLAKEGIVERGFSHMNEFNQIQDMRTDHFTLPTLLMRSMQELKDFTRKYQVQPKNPDGLLIEDLGELFKLLDGESGKVVDPIDWTASFIAYCGDDIEFPFPIYDFDYVLTKIFSTMHNAIVIDQQRRQPNAIPNRYNSITYLTGIQMNLKKIKQTKIDEDDDEVGQQVFKNDFKFVFQCDYSTPGVKKVEEGIQRRFREKVVWQNFYAFDIQYLQTVVGIQKSPQYLFIHTNRIGYAPNKDESEQIQLLLNPKCRQRVRTKRILDICDIAENNIFDKLEAGRYERNNLFNTFQVDDKFKDYVSQLKKSGVDVQDYTETQLKYMYFDKKLFELDIFHQYYFEPLKGAKPTGQYRIVGMILHKGEYYHAPDPTHTLQSQYKHNMQDCKGTFKTLMYNKGNEWLEYEGANIKKATLDDALSEQYWGDGEWTPIVLLYRQMTIRHMQIQVPQD